MNITANDLKTSGVKVLAKALQNDNEAVITVREKGEYVVLRLAYYDYLRECELAATLNEVKQDIASSQAKTISAAQHLADLK